MNNKIVTKLNYWRDIISRRKELNSYQIDHRVKLYNWSRPFEYDLWLTHFIEKRGLLQNKPKSSIAIYSIFGPFWLSCFDGADARIFVDRENLHKPTMCEWLHRFLDDDRVDLSLGFDKIDHPQYMHLPFWIMWSVFSPIANYQDIKAQIRLMDNVNNHSYTDRKYCAFLRGHGDFGCRELYDEFSTIDKVDCDGRLFHNNDDLKILYNDNKLEYLKHYRFNLTPENSNYEGYVTEKVFEAIASGCVPIYYGSNNNPESNILNKDAIVFIEVGKDNSEVVKFVEDVNSNERRYMEFACQNRFVHGAADVIWEYYQELEQRLKEIINNI